MNKILSIIIIMLTILICFRAGKAFAISLDVHPNPADVGQPVTNDISVRFQPPSPAALTSPGPTFCEVLIDFGDGRRASAGICRRLDCALSVTHGYSGAGRYVVIARVNSQKCNRKVSGSTSTRKILTVKCPALSFYTPSSLPEARIESAYHYQLSATGGQPGISYALTKGNLPPGLVLSRGGVISGIPTAEGNYSFKVAATDSCPLGTQHAEQNFTINVKGNPTTQSALCPDLSIVKAQALPGGEVQRPYSTRIAYSGGSPPVRLSIAGGRLPRGIFLSSEGVLSGIPKEAGRFTFSVKATDSCPKGPQGVTGQFVLDIKPPQPTPTTRNLSVSVSPKRVIIPRGMSSILNLVYTFSGGSDINTTLKSTQGFFDVNGRKIGLVSKSLMVHVRNGRATVTEKVNVPVAVLKRAERLGTTRFTYKRAFINEEFNLPVSASIVITTEAASGFRISRIQLYFGNKRAEITIARGQRPPRLFAEIRFLGTGLLKGYWEVDGRPVADVFKHITYGRSIVLELPATAVLPTFEPGVHRVRFVVTNPEFDAVLPEAIYYVTAVSYRVKNIRLLSPAKGKKISLNDLLFKWQGLDRGTFVYLVEFRGKKDGKPLFAAYVKSTSYQIPSRIAVRYFASSGTSGNIYWRVKGFDRNGELIGKSPLWMFTLTENASYVPGQVMLVWSTDQKNAIKKIEKLLGISLLYRFDLTVLKRTCGIFSTKGQSVPRIVERARSLPFIMHAGPNYIFQLNGDPLIHRQSIFDLLDISSLEALRSNKKVKVAVIDTGVDYMHPDLKGGVIERENYIHGEVYRPEIHGTAVAGIIGARRNNIGMEGIAPRALILALRACRQVRSNSPDGQCFSDSIARAINHAIENGAKVVNMSLGAYADDRTIAALIHEGKKRGVLFVAPVGNEKRAKKIPFPARLKDVLAIGCIDEMGNMFPNSSLCKEADILTPCENVFTTVSGGRHNFLSGTSMASAIAAGILTLDIAPPPRTLKRPVRICDWLRDALKKKTCKIKK